MPNDLESARRAAVLIPILTDPPALVYTLRRGHLNDHAGQISFPGGSVDPADESLLNTALREAEEEIGLPPDHVEVVGEMEDMYIPPSNFLVRPFVGLLKPGSRFEISPEEVEEVFSVRIEDLTLPETVTRRRWNRNGLDLDVPVFAVTAANGKPHDIWGATAAMTASLLTRLGWKSPLKSR